MKLSFIPQCIYTIFAIAILSVSTCSLNQVSPQQVFSITTLVDGPGSIKSNSNADSLLRTGTVVVFNAVADSNATFVCWNGDIHSTDNPLSITMTKNISIIGVFRKKPVSMVKISSTGKTFSMGSASALSAINERPVHRVMFTYDYFIDACEVTQGEYKTVMGVNPSVEHATQGTAGVGDSFPVYYVTWYDAVLFCNAKSKKLGLDTVYSFTAICQSGQSCPYVLENVSVHYDRMGYRLPTEAEWEYACRANSTSEFFWGANDSKANVYSWYSGNSNDQTHPVGQQQPNDFGLYDMAGNVAEWVNDWLGAYPDSLSVNPIGPINLPLEVFESSWQRPIRGGCYSLGTTLLRSSNRSGAYPVSASTINKYTGFRTAVGVFFPDTSSNSQSEKTTDSLPISFLCKKSDLISFMGTNHVKVVFTITTKTGFRKLCFVDFTDPDLKVRAISDSISANRPFISPNGTKVAYSSNREGFSGASITTVKLLTDASKECARTPISQPAFLPKWYVETASNDTFLVCCNGASMNNAPAWLQEKTQRWKISGLSFVGLPQDLFSQGSFTSGLSRDGQFLATGYPRALVYDTKENRVLQYFLPPFSGRDDTAQVCNVTISPGTKNPDEIMFLDFGYPRVSTIVGKSYGFHSIIFIANSNTQAFHHVTKWFEAPAGFQSWDGCAWSNHPDFAISVGNENNSESIGSLFIINVKDSTYSQILTGEGISDPSLWIDPQVLSETPDPNNDFAMYNIPSYGIEQLTLGEDLHYFWQHRNSIECGFVGSSNVMMGVDPARINSVKTDILACAGLDFTTGNMLINNYILKSAPLLKVVAMSLDPGWIPLDYSLADPHGIGLVDSRGYLFDKANAFYNNGINADIEKKILGFNAASWPDLDSSSAINGLGLGTGWGVAVYDGGDFVFADARVQTYLSLLQELADTLAQRKIHFVLVKFPESPGYKATGYVSIYGPNYSVYNQIVQWLQNEENSNSYFHFYDANMNGNHDYADSEAYDCNHLNELGRKKISIRLDSIFASIIK